MSTSHQKHRSA